MTVIIPAGAGGYGLTHQEMIDQVSDEIRNVTISAKITRWLNMVTVDLATEFVFQCLHKYASKTTAEGIPDIVLEADYLWLKTIEIPVNNVKLWPEDEQRLAEVYPSYRTTKGSISHYYFSGTNMIGLWQVPSSSVSVTYSYQKRPIRLVGSEDVSELPPEWHNLIVQKAITKGYAYEKNIEQMTKSQELEIQLIKKLGRLVYRRLDATTVMGQPGRGSKPPRVRFPSNYPKVR